MGHLYPFHRTSRMSDLREYKFLWGSQGDYVLLRCASEPDDVLPISMRNRPGEPLVISDDRLAAAVTAKMIRVGVPVVTEAELQRRLAELPPQPPPPPKFAVPP